MKALQWSTFWGGHLGRSTTIASAMVVAVSVLTAVPSLAGLMGVDFGLDRLAFVDRMAAATEVRAEVVRIFLHSLAEWTKAALALIIAVFAFGRCRTTHYPEALSLAAVLPAVALISTAHALAGWVPVAAANREEVSVFLCTGSRFLLALGLLLGVGVAVFLRPGPRAAQRIAVGIAAAWLALALLFLGMAAAGPPRMLSASAVVPRPWDLVPLVLFAISGSLVFPELHRRRPSILSHALIVSTVPQVVAQLEVAFGSLYPHDSHFVVAHFDQLLAYATLLGGILLDYVQAQRTRDDAMHDFESAQLELRKQTQELARLDRERVDHDLKRQQAERSLRLMEKAIETMNLGVTVTDLKGKILYVNQADARMHGYTVEELLGRSASCFGPGGNVVSAELPVDILHSAKPTLWTRERTNVTRDGREFPVRLISDVVRDASDQPLALVTICEDISEQRQIKQALARRDRIVKAVGLAAERFLADASWEERVGEVLESLKAATGVDRIYLRRVEDPSVKPPGADTTWSALAGVSREAIKPSLRLPGGDELFARWEKELRQGRLLQGNVRDLPEAERVALEARGVRSFAVIPVSVAGVWLGLLCLEDGDDEREWSTAELEALRTAARTFGAAIQRRQVDEALAASQAKFQDLLENASDLVQSVDLNGRFQFVNRAWMEALGYTQEEVRDLTLWDVIDPQHHDHCRRITQEIIASGEPGSMETVFVTRDGVEITVEGSVNCRYEDGRPVATRGIFRDITERKIVDRMKQEFISTVSHELRTPLTSIIAALGLLDSGRLAADRERTNELISVAYRNSNRLLQLINDLLDLQKLAAGKMTFRLGTVEVRTLIDEAVDDIRSFADSVHIALDVGPVPPEMRIVADHDRLIQVVNNLLSNAIKFSPEGARVEISARRKGRRVVVSVADQGPGIPEEFQKSLFDKFTQVDASATRTSGGSGLGLSIVKGLVEGMRGRISVDTRIGEGTTFNVELPVAD